MLAAAMLLPFASQAQNTLTVADGTNTNSYVPVYGVYVDDFVRCQTIYPASEIASSALAYDMTGGTITGLTYYLSTPATASWGAASFVVKMMEVTSTTLSSFVDMTNATTVYTGSLDATQSTMEITFSTPYVYQGGNLLIEIYNTLEGTYKSASFYGVNTTGASWQGNNGTSVDNITGATRAFIPKTTFTFTGGTEITCRPVTNLHVDDLQTTPSSLTLSWTDNLNTSATYSVYAVDATGSTLVQSNITNTTYTVTGLNANTEYTFGVVANCSATEEATMQTTSGRTSCATESLPFTEDFSTSLSNNPCWRGASVLYTDGVTPTLGSISGWSYQSSVNNGLPAGHYRVNIFGTTCKYWLITPSIDFTTATNPLLTFDAAFTVYTSTSSNPANTTNIADDKFMILASTDDGTTWTTASIMDLTQLASSSYLTQYVDLSAFAGETVRIATLTWDGTANSYNVYAITATDTTFVQNVTNTTFTISGLNAMSNYTYGVESVCGSNESQMVVVSFNTPCTAVDLPYTETFEATSGSIACWTTDGPGNWTVGTGDNSSTTGAFEGFLNAKITHGSTGDATKLISPVLDNVTDGLKLDFAYVMRAWSSDIDELHVYSRADADSAWQQVAAYTDAAATWTVANVIIPGTVYQVAFEFVDGYGYGLGIDSVVFSEMAGDYCYAVSNLTAGNATANSIDLSWLDANNSGASYTVYNMADTSVVASNVSGNNYTVSGLNASTAYTFGVVANCSATSASDIVTVSAATGCVGGSCNIYVYAQDSYGDGWNGATINFLQNGVNVDSYSMAGQGVSNTVIYDTAAVSVCAGAPISLNWTSGSWDSEITVEIANSFGDVLFTASGSDLTGEFLVLDSCSAVATVDTTTGDVTITFAVNDATMGTTNPAPGTYTYTVGEAFTLSVIPNAGYRIVDLTADLAGTTYHLGNISSYTDSAYAEYDSIIFTAIFAEDCPDSVAIPYVDFCFQLQH